MLTEHISPRFVDLDSWSTSDMIEAMYDGQLVACAAVRPALPAINAAVDDCGAGPKARRSLGLRRCWHFRSHCGSGRRRAWSDIRLAKRSYRFRDGWRNASGAAKR